MDTEEVPMHGSMPTDEHAASMFEQSNLHGMDIEVPAKPTLSKSESITTPRLKTTISLISKSLIHQLYFGSMVTQIISEDGTFEEGEEELFGPILLDPKTNYFYKSWEAYFYNTIENFRGTEFKAKKWDLVLKFPDILCFQIQRAGYNIQRKAPEKNNQRFEFDQEIYVDRFLMKNKRIVEGLRNKAETLEAERTEIDSQLKGMSNFRENRDVIKSLEDVIQLLKVLNSQKDNEANLPEELRKLVFPGQNEMASQLDDLRQNFVSEKEKLQERSFAIDKEIKGLYKDIEHTKYVLFSVIIHEGTADHGHFYCFVKMHDKWYKFNDFFVREMEEIEVLETSFGFEGSTANAYCAFYMNEHIFNDFSCHNFALLKEYNLKQPGSKEGYFNFVTPSKLFNIELSNKSFQTELCQGQLKKIQSEYIQKFDKVTLKYEERYKDWKKKVHGLRSIGDFFISNLN